MIGCSVTTGVTVTVVTTTTTGVVDEIDVD